MPGLAAVVILSLGVGIGVNTAVFSWLQAILLKPIPGVDDSGSFYHVEPKADTGTYPGMSWSEYRDLIPQLQSIEDLVASRMAPLNVGEGARIARESDSGLTCPPGDAAGLARVVTAALALSAGERHAMGRRGRSYVQRHYDRRTLAIRYHDLLDEVISNT